MPVSAPRPRVSRVHRRARGVARHRVAPCGRRFEDYPTARGFVPRAPRVVTHARARHASRARGGRARRSRARRRVAARRRRRAPPRARCADADADADATLRRGRGRRARDGAAARARRGVQRLDQGRGAGAVRATAAGAGVRRGEDASHAPRPEAGAAVHAAEHQDGRVPGDV